MLAKRFHDLISGVISSGKRVIKVLEVGSGMSIISKRDRDTFLTSFLIGTGALTRHLIKAMEKFPDAINEFVVSDVSKELIPRMEYPHCRYKSFDLTVPPSEQGLESMSFDVILGFHVLHVAKEMQPTLDALGDLLVPGGSLLIGDLRGDSWAAGQPGSLWFDFVFGSFAEWFSFTDDRNHCTMSPDVWVERLYNANFAQVYSECYTWDPLLFSLEAQRPQFILHRPVNGFHHVEVSRDIRNARIRMEALCYHRGDEQSLRKLLLDSELIQLSLWLFTNSPTDRYAGMGFSRSLAREYPDWDIHFVIFDSDWSGPSMLECIYQLEANPEPLLQVDNEGKIYVPRVIPSSTPSGSTSFDPSTPWSLSDDSIKPEFITRAYEDFVVVDILALSSEEGALRGFVGRRSGQLVCGISASKNIVNKVVTHKDSLFVLSEHIAQNAALIAGSLVALVICRLGLGLPGSRGVLHTKRRSVLVTHASHAIAPSLRWALGLSNADVIEAKPETVADLVQLAQHCDHVLSGSEDPIDVQIFTSRITPRKRVFFWNERECGVEGLLKVDPTAIGDALHVAITSAAGRWFQNSSATLLQDIQLPPSGTRIPASPYLFDPTKAYLLVGGIGGVGIRIALWMYQVGIFFSPFLTT